jgi:tRNA(Ile)-lysidine synthase
MKANTLGAAWLARRLQELGVPARGACLCVAYSGGADSTALLAALAALPRRSGWRIRALHVNHQLQADAGNWANTALAIAAALGVPARVLTVHVETAGRSIEAAAREARYAALGDALEAGEFLLTAHHQEDQAETLLLQLLRGAGVAGLAAMPARARFARGWMLRPLLDVGRDELRQFVTTRGVVWVDDPSNTDPRFDRSFLRRRIMPLLLERWPATAMTLHRSAAHLAEAQQLLDTMADKVLDRAAVGAAVQVVTLRALTLPERSNLLRRWLRCRGLPAPDQRQLRELTTAILSARPDAKPVVRWPGAEVHRHDGLLHAMSPLSPQPDAASWVWPRRRTLVIPGAGMLKLVSDPHGNLCLGRLPQRLELRFRSGGERLAMAGGHKPLKDLLREQGLPPWQRERLPLIYAAAELVAVANLWVAPAYLSSAGSKQRARFHWLPEIA